ncbi:MAG: hypothetical protein LBC53_00180 [Spirochaetaceae bacterium]|nr:hypothetical protein [Spirochaetaceae bacterium]
MKNNYKKNLLKNGAAYLSVAGGGGGIVNTSITPKKIIDAKRICVRRFVFLSMPNRRKIIKALTETFPRRAQNRATGASGCGFYATRILLG